MQSRQNGDFKRSVLSALAALVAAAIPTLVPASALAEKAKSTDAPAADKESKAPAKSESKKAKKASSAKKSAKKAEKNDKPEAKPEEAQAKPEAKAHASASKGKKSKKTASRSAGAKKKAVAKKGDSDAPRRRCAGTPIMIDRGGLEGQSLTLVDCHDKPLDKADEALSVLARPWGAAKPTHVAAAKHAKTASATLSKGSRKAPELAGIADPSGKATLDPAKAAVEIAPGVKLLDKGLLTRVAAIAKHFPNRPISLVSGYRPQSRGSLHQLGRALDLRVAGVTNEELVAFCKTLRDTGCGYYPNSSFIHVDVRNPGTGTVTWIDTSGPGDAPNYVTRWPPPAEQSETAVLPPQDVGAHPKASSEEEHNAHHDEAASDEIDPYLP
ncbi:Histone H1 [Minicystis rosea]|nr:Histone H1 [Minicystis rosea]